MNGCTVVKSEKENSHAGTTISLNEAFSGNDIKFEPLQLPYREDDHWIAVEYPKTFQPDGEFLSVVAHVPVGHDETQTQSGLFVDGWTEVIPNEQETTGLAVHYNQPNSEPPQVLLLAITPEITNHWKWGDLMATMHETLDSAKKRAVEPDQIEFSQYAHFLPAVMCAMTAQYGTIAADFAANVSESINSQNQNSDGSS